MRARGLIRIIAVRQRSNPQRPQRPLDVGVPPLKRRRTVPAGPNPALLLLDCFGFASQ